MSAFRWKELQKASILGRLWQTNQETIMNDYLLYNSPKLFTLNYSLLPTPYSLPLRTDF
ncbi:MAG: hypothetical protein F6K54_11315 [Okeania sp. SIO3B5]|uniref:hypothetical protein n=1 Tax=Okeania sp. SIO3B5 TaxID=2607811 RepID=UPI0013FEAB89|nr:hypothetical protein [Okeania sp. SIO3B5]NEO53617.1 hypothetical protein [Okeania sp. SIO3B5]